MASVVTERKTYTSKTTGKEATKVLYRVDFTHPTTSKREVIRFGGKFNKKQARDFASLLEDLLSVRTSKKENAAVDEWLRDMDADTHAKLVEFNLAEPRIATNDLPVMEYIDNYITSRKDATERTRLNYKQARDFLAKFLTDELKQPRTVKTFTKADAKHFRNWLLSQHNFKRNSHTHSDNYVRTQCKNLKLFFGAAVDARLIAENPFKDKSIPCKVQPVPERMVYVTAEDTAKLLDNCPDIEWKVVIALARWGGLRIPSEITGLKWDHINRATSRMIIPQPKLKRVGKAHRVTPIFPELATVLQEAWDLAPTGAVYVLPRLRGEAKNLRTTLNKIALRAGVAPWEKPFQNLRSTRATELAEEFPLKTVCDWLGHDIQISLQHYQQVREEHWDRAISGAPKKGAAKGAAATREIECK